MHSCITKKQELIVTIKYKKLIKKLRLSYNSDDDIIAGAWLRDDYIRSMDYPHTLNFTDEEHEGMRLKYGYHQKKDWVSKIKGQVV